MVNGFGVEGERKRMDRERVKTQHGHHRERIGSNKQFLTIEGRREVVAVRETLL